MTTLIGRSMAADHQLGRICGLGAGEDVGKTGPRIVRLGGFSLGAVDGGGPDPGVRSCAEICRSANGDGPHHAIGALPAIFGNP